MSLCADMSLCIKLFQSVLWHRVAKFTTITSFNIIIINQLLSAIFNLKKRLTETSFLCTLVSRALATKDVLYRSPPLCTVLFSHQHAPSSSPLSFNSSSGRIFLFFQCLIFPNPPDYIKLSRIVLRLHHCVNLLYENNTPTQYVNIYVKSVAMQCFGFGKWNDRKLHYSIGSCSSRLITYWVNRTILVHHHQEVACLQKAYEH